MRVGVRRSGVARRAHNRLQSVISYCMGKSIDYRKIAFKAYDPVCVHCGFGIISVLEVAHIDGDRSNNKLENLVILCPNCHKMYDLNLIPSEIITKLRDCPKKADWSKRMKDAGMKAAITRKWRRAGKKAAETRRRNKKIR